MYTYIYICVYIYIYINVKPHHTRGTHEPEGVVAQAPQPQP